MIDSAMSRRREKVTLIHGFASSSLWMSRLNRRIKTEGFATCVYDYVTLIGDIEVYAQKLAQVLRQTDEAGTCDCQHIVAHSMGGLVARRALQIYRPQHLGRVLFLASPHHGLYAGRIWGGLLGLMHCRAVGQMSDLPNSYVNQLAPPDFEFGVIAASYDHLVPLQSAKLTGCNDFRIYPALHLALLLRSDVAQDVCSYLEHGRFGESGKRKAESGKS